MLDKRFDFKINDNKVLQQWQFEQAFVFNPNPQQPVVTYLLPPPNVTGSLHLGHALNQTTIDCLARYNRLMGKTVLWQPGLDHAGIATQMVVEKDLLKRNQPSRVELGRDRFLQAVQDWKAQSGDTIIKQSQKLGSSCAWERQRYTMDEAYAQTVKNAFIQLYNQDLIYKAKRLVNWDTVLKTAISDLEIKWKEEKTHLYHIKYYLENSTDFIVVATTRPETLFGDVAVMMHPESELYAKLKGKRLQLPFVNRLLPIIADTTVDPNFGTGCVKVTPAHDANDDKVAKKHNLPYINILSEEGRVLPLDFIPEQYHSLSVKEARKLIIKELQNNQQLEAIQDHLASIPYGDRSDSVIELLLTDQWFLDVEGLAKQATQVVNEGQIRFVPESAKAIFLQWMNNIQPWCISRQLWWGHQIPAWYAPDGKVFVANSLQEAQKQAQALYGQTVNLTQDEDVLDTWFSSALWPVETLDYYTHKDAFKQLFPTDTLATGGDIIFFWVARMIMFSLHFTQQIPFKTVYLNPILTDEKGQKMSKTKGNGLDPLDLIDEFGADSLRYSLLNASKQGKDMQFSRQKVESARNFLTKLWNSARLLEMNDAFYLQDSRLFQLTHPLNIWMYDRLLNQKHQYHEAMQAYQFGQMVDSLYDCIWNDYCNFYLELFKIYQSDSFFENYKQEFKLAARYFFEEIIILLSPIVPFITQTLWSEMGNQSLVMASRLDRTGAKPITNQRDETINVMGILIEDLRSFRGLLDLDNSLILPVQVMLHESSYYDWFRNQSNVLNRICRVEIEFIQKDSINNQLKIDSLHFAYFVSEDYKESIINNKDKLQKKLDSAKKVIHALEGKLSNDKFLANAEYSIIEETKKNLIMNQKEVATVQQLLQFNP